MEHVEVAERPRANAVTNGAEAGVPGLVGEGEAVRQVNARAKTFWEKATAGAKKVRMKLYTTIKGLIKMCLHGGAIIAVRFLFVGDKSRPSPVEMGSAVYTCLTEGIRFLWAVKSVVARVPAAVKSVANAAKGVFEWMWNGIKSIYNYTFAEARVVQVASQELAVALGPRR